jgi:hypothetical protein
VAIPPAEAIGLLQVVSNSPDCGGSRPAIAQPVEPRRPARVRRPEKHEPRKGDAHGQGHSDGNAHLQFGRSPIREPPGAAADVVEVWARLQIVLRGETVQQETVVEVGHQRARSPLVWSLLRRRESSVVLACASVADTVPALIPQTSAIVPIGRSAK